MSKLQLKIPEAFEPLLKPMRYKGAFGGRGSGKSQFFATLVIIRCLQQETRVVCIREVQNSIRDSVRQLLVDKIIEMGLVNQFHIVENEIRHANGSLIVFKGMQSYNAANIKSLEGFDIAWCEESQTLSQHSLDLLRPTLRKPGSELWFSWNPLYKTDAVDKFFRKNPPPNAICIFANWNSNPWFKETPLYEDMVSDYAIDPDKAEHVWGGGYGQAQGAIIAKWVNAAEREGRITNDVVYDPKGAPIVISCDLGFNDAASWWYWQPVVGGYNVLRYDYDHGLDAEDWIPRIQSNLLDMGIKDIGTIWMPHDARSKTFQTKRTSQEQFQQGFGVGKIRIVPMTSKLDRIEAGRHLIDKCAFNKTGCEDGIDGLRAWEFEYNEDEGVFSRHPKHNWASHPSDAFTYGCQVLQEEVIKQKDKPPKFWDEQSLDQLWKSNSRKGTKRI